MTDRAFVLGRLQRELRAAEDVHEDGYAAEIRQEIARLSQGTAANPATERTAARRPGGHPRPGPPARA